MKDMPQQQAAPRARRFLNPWRVAGWSLAALLLALPAVAMQFTSEVQWDGFDFAVMGIMLGSLGLGIEFAVRQSGSGYYRLGALIALLVAFLTIWANLAVGMIGSEDNPYNLLFGGVLVLAAAGAGAVRFSPGGLAWVALGAAAAQLLIGGLGYAHDPRGATFSMAFALPWLLAAGLFRGAKG